MKIISKYKDYYDYLSGIYGEDPLIVLDRRDFCKMDDVLGWDYPHMKESKKIVLFIGGYKIEGFLAGMKSNKYRGVNIYYGDNLKKIDDYPNLPETYTKAKQLIKKSLFKNSYCHNKSSLHWNKSFKNMDDIVFINMDNKQIEECIINTKIIQDTNNYNEKYDCPILYKISDNKFLKYPNLSMMNLSSYMTPEHTYHIISDWISEQKTKLENKVDNRTNIEKIESKGFDKKISFRGK